MDGSLSFCSLEVLVHHYVNETTAQVLEVFTLQAAS